MNYALDQFTMTHHQVFMVQGANSLFTYQNTGLEVALLQGSNDSIQWADIVEVQMNSAIVQEHSYKYLRSIGNTQLLVNRGEGNNHNDSSPVISVNQKTGAVLLTANDVQADPKGSSDSVKAELQTHIDALTTHKLDASEYIQHFKGVFPSKAALDLAFPTAQAGDTADIDSGSGFDVMRAIWDANDHKWVIREVNNAQNTDQVSEGNNNKYFSSERVRQTLVNSLDLSVSQPIQISDSLIAALGKLQAQINTNSTPTWVNINTVATLESNVENINLQMSRINGNIWIRGNFKLINSNTNSESAILSITDPNYKTYSFHTSGSARNLILFNTQTQGSLNKSIKLVSMENCTNTTQANSAIQRIHAQSMLLITDGAIHIPPTPLGQCAI